MLPDVLAAADVAAVLLRFEKTDERTMIQCAKVLAPIVQNAGSALILDGQFEITARSGADGANVYGIDLLEDALSTLKPDRILGIGGLNSRHDAMVAGDAGADYLLFGEPDEHGDRPSSEAIFERLQWWAEIFEPPCVGFAVSAEEAGLFAEAGADFILVGDFIWQDSRGPRTAMIETSTIVKKHFELSFGQSAVT